jgi:hypothetical protein
MTTKTMLDYLGVGGGNVLSDDELLRLLGVIESYRYPHTRPVVSPWLRPTIDRNDCVVGEHIVFLNGAIHMGKDLGEFPPDLLYIGATKMAPLVHTALSLRASVVQSNHSLAKEYSIRIENAGALEAATARVAESSDKIAKLEKEIASLQSGQNRAVNEMPMPFVCSVKRPSMFGQAMDRVDAADRAARLTERAEKAEVALSKLRASLASDPAKEGQEIKIVGPRPEGRRAILFVVPGIDEHETKKIVADVRESFEPTQGTEARIGQQMKRAEAAEAMLDEARLEIEKLKGYVSSLSSAVRQREALPAVADAALPSGRHVRIAIGNVPSVEFPAGEDQYAMDELLDIIKKARDAKSEGGS